jgi:hypothetical protein
MLPFVEHTRIFACASVVPNSMTETHSVYVRITGVSMKNSMSAELPDSLLGVHLAPKLHASGQSDDHGFDPGFVLMCHDEFEFLKLTSSGMPSRLCPVMHMICEVRATLLP